MTASAFELLDPKIQRFLWQAQWDSLRPAQEKAIPAILERTQDLIIAAPTAAGKTEAAFLPALTAYMQHAASPGASPLLLYISPLKALINDQYARLEPLCEMLNIPVTPWHGDIPQTKKNKFLKNPKGILLITPESLEALLCRRGTEIPLIFKSLLFVIIDELHAFIGSERGKQLQSLLHRIETGQKRRIRRIGLSATLGNMALGAEFLRPHAHMEKPAAAEVEIIDVSAGETKMKILVKGYENREPLSEEEKEILHALQKMKLSPEDYQKALAEMGLSEEILAQKQDRASAAYRIAQDLFKHLLGGNHLIFPNTRQDVEYYTHLLNQFCEENKIIPQFWPHHGNLSQKLRIETEQALKHKERPAIGVCTSTLELGIDINRVKSIAQINPPPSVANLRQRLGRSGRGKGESPILRGYVIEDRLTEKSSLEDRLRVHTLQMAASISLLLQGWCEPPQTKGLHGSTLVQQLLSLIAQYNGLPAGAAYQLLCAMQGAPFPAVTPAYFKSFLQHLGTLDLLTQDHSGILLHGEVGDRIVNHFEFFASFKSQDEFRLVAGGKTLGTLPIRGIMTVGTTILFAGRPWLVESLSEAEKTLYLAPTRRAAVKIHGEGGRVHHQIRQEMRAICRTSTKFRFLDEKAKEFIEQARQTWQEEDLENQVLIDYGKALQILTWAGDNENEAMMCFLNHEGIRTRTTELGLLIDKEEQETEEILEKLRTLKADPHISAKELLKDAENLQREKWDWALPETLLWENYASMNLNLKAGAKWLNEFIRRL